MRKMIFSLVMAVWILSGAAHVALAQSESAPHAVIEGMTDRLVTTIEAHRGGFEQNPQPFYSALEALLDEALDFKWIAYNVMGPYRKQASQEQHQRFAEKFRRDLVETYGGGLIAFGEQTIVVLPPSDDVADRKTVQVAQEVRSADGNFPLQYTMGKKRSGEWKITNVIINGVNLGKTFRNQFIQRAQQYGGDLDQVIEHWSATAEGDA